MYRQYSNATSGKPDSELGPAFAAPAWRPPAAVPVTSVLVYNIKVRGPPTSRLPADPGVFRLSRSGLTSDQRPHRQQGGKCGPAQGCAYVHLLQYCGLSHGPDVPELNPAGPCLGSCPSAFHLQPEANQ